MLIPIKNFTGEFPRMRPYALPENAAAQSKNCEFRQGVLTGLAGDVFLNSSGSNIKSVFTYQGNNGAKRMYWWNRDVDAVQSPVVGDAYSRFYWSDGTGFYVSEGSKGGNGEPDATTNRKLVGVPRPAAALTSTLANMSFPAIDVVRLVNLLGDGSTTHYADADVDAADVVYTYSPSDLTITFPCPDPASLIAPATVTTTTKKKGATTGDWRPLVDAFGASAIVTVSSRTVPAYTNSISFGPGDTVIYYDDPLVLPDEVRATFVSNSDSGDTVNTMYRLGNTYWYGSNENITPPNQFGPTNPQETETSIAAASAVVGMGVNLILEFDPADDNPKLIRKVLSAITVAQTEGATVWPTDLQGKFNASYKWENGTCTVLIQRVLKDVEARAYTYTYVNAYNEEGPPAEPLEILDCAKDMSFTLGYTNAPDNYTAINKIRVYRTATGTSTDYMYVGYLAGAGVTDDSGGKKLGDLSTTTPTFIDTVDTEYLGETLSTYNYSSPDQTIRGLCMMANGIMVGFKNNELHFSEPYLPYAYNPSAVKPLPSPIVGICPFEGGLYVTTTGHPYIVTGVAPEYMTDAKVPAIQAGLTKGSIVALGNSVVYASNDGLVMAQGLSASLDASYKFFTREKWLELYSQNLENIRLAVHDGTLLMWFDNGALPVMIRLEEAEPSMTNLTSPIYAAYIDPTDDALIVSNGNSIYQFAKDQADRAAFEWRSKTFILPKPTNLGAIQLIGFGTFEIDVYVDLDLVLGFDKVCTITLDAGPQGLAVARLPSGFLSRRYAFHIRGSEGSEIREFYAATSVTEFANG
jgi:hypothetical protein